MTLFKYTDLCKLYGLTSSQRLVAFALAARDNKKLGCFPSQQQIAVDTGLKITAVKRALAALEKLQYIEVTRSARGSHDGNEYHLVFLKMPPRSRRVWDDDDGRRFSYRDDGSRRYLDESETEFEFKVTRVEKSDRDEDED